MKAPTETEIMTQPLYVMNTSLFSAVHLSANNAYDPPNSLDYIPLPHS